MLLDNAITPFFLSEPCGYSSCDGIVLPERLTASGRALDDSASANAIDLRGMVKAATTVFVVDPTSTGE